MTEKKKKKKRPYTKPRLIVHGDIRTFTLEKAGTKGDGMFKPATRASGGAA